MVYCPEYSSSYAHFIAGGKTLELVRQFDEDSKNPDAMAARLAAEFGARKYEHYIGFTYEPTDTQPDAAMTGLAKSDKLSNDERYIYKPDLTTEAGKALQARIKTMPFFAMTYAEFALQLTGATNVETNPDDLYSTPAAGTLKGKQEDTAAMYEKIGETFIIKTPRILRGIFQTVSRGAGDEYQEPVGHRYEWLTPTDCTPITYGEVLCMKEKLMADQAKPVTVMYQQQKLG